MCFGPLIDVFFFAILRKGGACGAELDEYLWRNGYDPGLDPVGQTRKFILGLMKKHEKTQVCGGAMHFGGPSGLIRGPDHPEHRDYATSDVLLMFSVSCT